MGRLWQAAGTVGSILESRTEPRLLENAAACGLRSLFVGFETITPANLEEQGKDPHLERDYAAAISRLHGLGIMVNGSFVFGLDHDGAEVFDRTVEWAIGQGVETATFHILTPYPGTALYTRLEAQGRLLHRDWDLYDTRHAVFRPARMAPQQLEEGYWRAHQDFYTWRAILRSARTKPDSFARLRHVAYTAGWKKFEPLWDLILRAKRVSSMLPLLEAILEAAPGREASRSTRPEPALASPYRQETGSASGAG